jgi:hypothetical protein
LLGEAVFDEKIISVLEDRIDMLKKPGQIGMKILDQEAWTLKFTSSSLLKNPRHGERVVIQFSVTNRRRLACGAHL